MTRELSLVAISLFTWGLGEGMFMFFQPIYLQQLGADPAAIGGILGGVAIAMTITHLPAGYISDRIGQRPLLWASWVLGILATGMMAVSTSMPWFVAGMLFYGFTGFVVSPLNSYVAASRGRLGVGRALSLIQSAYNLGAVVGPTLGGWIAQQYSIITIYRVSFVIFCISTVFLFFIRKSPESPQAQSEPAAPVFRNRPFLAFLPLLFLTSFAGYLPQPLTPNFLQNQRSLSLEMIGNLGSISSLGTALIFLAMGSLNPTLGLIAGQVFVGLFALLVWNGNSMIWYAIGFFFVGGFRLSRAMGVAITQSFVQIRSTGLAFGILELVNGLAMFLAPLAAGFLYEKMPELVYMASTGLIVVTILLNAWLLPILKKWKMAVQFATSLE